MQMFQKKQKIHENYQLFNYCTDCSRKNMNTSLGQQNVILNYVSLLLTEGGT